MYRKPNPKQTARRQASIDALKRGRERAAMAREPRGRPPDLPDLRREVTVTDHDTGVPVTHVMRLYRSDRVDCYRAEADGRLWKVRVGWSAVLADIRKAYQRVPGKRSDFWW
jgi:hypothetical protein